MHHAVKSELECVRETNGVRAKHIAVMYSIAFILVSITLQGVASFWTRFGPD